MNAQEKYHQLLKNLSHLDSVLVAYSGGVDSTLVATACHAVLGDRCVAVLATGDTYPISEVDYARDLAEELGFRLLEVETHELADPRFSANPTDRCYWCKGELYSLLRTVAEVNSLDTIADGSNADDLSDFRPGRQACAELGVVSPLAEVGLTKAHIREIARDLGLRNWNKPSMACLASRFPYGTAITEEGLTRVERAEASLRELGLSQFRVRSHGELARVEVEPTELQLAWSQRETIAQRLKESGFTWSAMDLQGYRTGALNEGLGADERLSRS